MCNLLCKNAVPGRDYMRTRSLLREDATGITDQEKNIRRNLLQKPSAVRTRVGMPPTVPMVNQPDNSYTS